MVKFVLFAALPQQPFVYLRGFLHLRAHLIGIVLLLFDDLIDDDFFLFLLDSVDHSREHVHVAYVRCEALLKCLVLILKGSVFVLPLFQLFGEVLVLLLLGLDEGLAFFTFDFGAVVWLVVDVQQSRQGLVGWFGWLV